MAPSHLVLLGDSILDNAPYTTPKPDTAAHLRRLIGERWSVELLARDGARMAEMQEQVDLIDGPAVAVLSIGGNDATRYIGMLGKPATSVGGVIGDFLAIADGFAPRYAAVVDALVPRVSRLVLCTLYDVRLEPPEAARLVRLPIALINDRIIGVAIARGLEVIDLRAVCTEDADFTLQIEPSPQGAEKIARAIAAVVDRPDEQRYGRIVAL
jgi:hypothetical protein